MPVSVAMGITFLGLIQGEGFEVHRIDFNPSNSHLSNLIVLTKSDHIKLHKEIRQLEKEAIVLLNSIDVSTPRRNIGTLGLTK